ncbi:MAG: four helix bundle protein [Cyanobacteria bacterium P01_F01_bin.143]
MKNKQVKIRYFEDLRVWQSAISLAKSIYLITRENESLSRDFSLVDQLRRASVSVSANIAEGFERRSQKEYRRFLSIAKGSAGEVRSLLTLAYEVGYIDPSTHQELRELTLKISRMLGKQMRVLEGYITAQKKPYQRKNFSKFSKKAELENVS